VHGGTYPRSDPSNTIHRLIFSGFEEEAGVVALEEYFGECLDELVLDVAVAEGLEDWEVGFMLGEGCHSSSTLQVMQIELWGTFS